MCLTDIIVRTTKLSRIYQLGSQEIRAVNRLDLAIPHGSLTVVKGRSGSGKTTLLNLIGGLDYPTSGEVYVTAKKLSQLSDRELTEMRRNTIGFVFQSFALLPTFSAYENVELPLRMNRAEPERRNKRVTQCLEMVGLGDWWDHRPYELSGGQQQRLAIARALANSPALILADEPTGELDSHTGRDIIGLLQSLVRELGITIVIATHDPAVEECATVIYELRDGKIAATAS
jgi:ABC-type lipoprotein export system ATPase subunit